MSFYFSKDLRKISKYGLDRRWFKFKRLYLILEEEARSGNRSVTITDLRIQEIEFLEEEKFKLTRLPDTEDGSTYACIISW